MITSWFYNRLDREGKEDLVVCILLGLFCGLFFGLVATVSSGLLLFGLFVALFVGLATGLSADLSVSLAAGLSFGLLFALFAGLFSGLLFALGTGLFPFSIPLFIAIVAAEETLYWLDREKLPLNRSTLSFTAQKKLEALFEIGLVMGAYSYVYELGKDLVDVWLAAPLISQLLHQVAPYVLSGAIVASVFLLGRVKYAKQSED